MSRNLCAAVYLGKKAPAGFQIREFLEHASTALGEPLLGVMAAESWDQALRAVAEKWPGPGKLVIALDEFQWITAASPELPSLLQGLWDRDWKRQGKLMIILCGSYIGFMEREVLGRQSPLFGRRTAQILLRPFGFREAAEFHPAYSLDDRVRTYFICGGIPFYLEFFSDRLPVEKNIELQILEEHSALHREPDFLLREELRELENYHAILLSITTGGTTARAISERTGVGERALQYYLRQLEELGYVGRRFPLAGKPTALIPRRVRYVIADHLLRFWFQFVFPSTSHLAQKGAAWTLRNQIRPRLDAFYAACFEELCREALPGLYERQGRLSASRIGQYWSKSTQIDVVAVGDDGWIDLGECKWGPVRSLARLLQELETKLPHYPNPGGATIGRLLFTRRRVPAAGRGRATWWCLEDFYA